MSSPSPAPRPILCIGAANVDRKLRTLAPLMPRTSNPARQHESFGGVGRNIAENLARLGVPTALMTAVGDDAAGRALLDDARSAGVDTCATLTVDGASTGTYTAVLDHDGELAVALADMALYETLTPAVVAQREAALAGAALVVADLNLPHETVAALLRLVSHDAGVRVGTGCPPYPAFADAHARAGTGCPPYPASADAHRAGTACPPYPSDSPPPHVGWAPRAHAYGAHHAPLILVAVSEPKMNRLPDDLHGLRLLLLNAGELAARVGRALPTESDLAAACREVQAQGAQDVIVTRGARGVMYTTPERVCQIPAAPAQVVEVTGAGDAFAAAVCWSLYQGCDDLALACRRGLHLSALTLGCAQTVCPDLGPGTLEPIKNPTQQD